MRSTALLALVASQMLASKHSAAEAAGMPRQYNGMGYCVLFQLRSQLIPPFQAGRYCTTEKTLTPAGNGSTRMPRPRVS